MARREEVFLPGVRTVSEKVARVEVVAVVVSKPCTAKCIPAGSLTHLYVRQVSGVADLMAVACHDEVEWVKSY